MCNIKLREFRLVWK